MLVNLNAYSIRIQYKYTILKLNMSTINTMEVSSGGSMRGVLQRIEHYVGPLGHEKVVKDRAKQIAEITSAYYSGVRGPEILKGSIAAYNETTGKKAERAKEALEIQLAGYLFAQNRHIFEQRNGEGSMANYDANKELRQIEAVVRALEGQHGQIGTGEGKTSVILPITTIIKSLTTSEKSVIFSSDSTLRVNEFEKYVQPFIEQVKKDEIAKVTLKKEEEPHDAHVTTRETLASKVEKEALFDPTCETSYSPALNEALKTEYWQSTFQSMEEQKAKANQKKENLPTIEIMTHGELMGRYMRDEAGFKAQKAPIYMDEAHAPFDRGTPTQLTSESLVLSPENVRMATAEWVLHYIVGHSVAKEDVRYSSGVGTLTEKGMEHLGSLNLDELHRDGSSLNTLYKTALSKIHTTYSVESQSDKDLLDATVSRTIDAMFKSKEQGNQEDFSSYNQAIGEQIAKVYYMDSDAFVTTPDGKLVIRDAYQDELLLTHQYNRETELATRGLTGLFKVVLPKRASGSKKFSSLLKDMANRATCFSGTLINEEKKSPFAQFLEEVTKQKIFDLENPSKKTIPEPVVSADTEAATNELIKSLSRDSRGALIIDATTVDHAGEMYKKCVAVYGEENVRQIGSKPTGDVEKEMEYQQQVERYSTELAEGKIKILISSGSMGVGMNIIRADGSYPDIKVGVLGIPKSKLQFKQILGRRRAPDSTKGQDFHWHLGTNSIMEYVSFYQEEAQGLADNYARAIGVKKLGSDMIARLEVVKDNPKLLKEYLLEIMQNKETSKTSDLMYETEYDELHANALGYCEALLTERIITEVLGKKSFKNLPKKEIEAIMKGLTPEEKKTISQLVRIIGLPSSLYQELSQPLLRPLGVEDRSKRRIDLLKQIIMKESFLEEKMEEWNAYYFDGGVDYFNKFVKPMNEHIMLDGHNPGVFTSLRAVSPEFVQYKVVPAEGVSTPNGLQAMVRLNPDEEVPEPGKPHALCLAFGGTPYEVHPLSHGRQMTLNYGDPVRITRFPISMANGGTVLLFHKPKEEQKK